MEIDLRIPCFYMNINKDKKKEKSAVIVLRIPYN
jgi:hypothetical protein